MSEQPTATKPTRLQGFLYYLFLIVTAGGTALSICSIWYYRRSANERVEATHQEFQTALDAVSLACDDALNDTVVKWDLGHEKDMNECLESIRAGRKDLAQQKADLEYITGRCEAMQRNCSSSFSLVSGLNEKTARHAAECAEARTSCQESKIAAAASAETCTRANAEAVAECQRVCGKDYKPR